METKVRKKVIPFDAMMRTIDQKLFYKMIFLFLGGLFEFDVRRFWSWLVFGRGWINRQLVLIEWNLPFVGRS